MSKNARPNDYRKMSSQFSVLSFQSTRSKDVAALDERRGGCGSGHGGASRTGSGGKLAANSPQAKSRIERAHGTHQDRLVKKLRLVGIDHYDEANRYISIVEKVGTFLLWYDTNVIPRLTDSSDW